MPFFSFDSLFSRLVAFSLLLSFLLIVLSSLMRLSNQGLGCEDWPACYDRVDVVKYAEDIGVAPPRAVQPEALTPVTPVERAHRFVASLLLLSILAFVVVAWRGRKKRQQGLVLPLAILAVTLFLAVLGILYGSPLLRPPVVMANLLGGMALLGLLWWLHLSQGSRAAAEEASSANALRTWAVIGLLAIVVQTALGGWMSSNFAALACTTFPHCNGAWWPAMDIAEGFRLRQTLPVSAEGRVLTDPAAITGIHMVHRLSAILVILAVGWLAYRAFPLGGRLRQVALASLALVAVQAGLGIGVVLLGSPLATVVLHNAVAALLWLSMITLIRFLPRKG